MLYPIEVINQSLLAAYTLHVQETTGPVGANVIGHLGNIIHYVNSFECAACVVDRYSAFMSDIVSNLRDALDSLKSLSEILGKKHRLVSTAALAIGAAQDQDFDGITLGGDRYFSIEVDENNNVVSVTTGNTKVPFTLEYRLSKYGRWDAQLTWLSTVAEMRPGDVCLSDIADLLCEPNGPELFFRSYKAAEQIMEMLEPFEAKVLEPLAELE
jgi:hypothetical protein